MDTSGCKAPDENAGVQVVSLHPNPVSQNRAAAIGARGVNRDHTDGHILFASEAYDAVDDGALTASGCAGDSKAVGAAGVVIHFSHDFNKRLVATLN